MDIPWFDVKWPAILAATVAHMAVGGVWYGPAFGQVWAREIGLKKEDVQSHQVNRAMAITIGGAVLKSYGLALLIGMLHLSGAGAGLAVGLLLTVAIVLPCVASNQAFELRSRKFFWITAGHHLVGMAAMGAILGAWR